MENFTFFNPTRIEFGADKEQLIGQHLARHGVRKVLLCYGSERIKRDGLFDALKRQGLPTRRVETFHYTDLKALLRALPADEPQAVAGTVSPIVSDGTVF